MNRSWPAEALAFEESVSQALRSRGGIELTRSCEVEPARRERELRPLIESLGLTEIDFRAGEVEAAAAALGAKAAGQMAAPWPLVAQLAGQPEAQRTGRSNGQVSGRPSGKPGAVAVYLVDHPPRRVAHLDLVQSALAVDVTDGTCRRLEAIGPVAQMPLDPFGVPCRLGAEVECPAGAVAGHVVLSAFWVLGALETAVSLASAYSVERSQFGRPISSFGAIQWRLADLSAGRWALAEIAGFTLSRLIDGSITMADVWGLRLTMIESAETVLSDAHQVLGAIGLCEEHDVTLIDRHVQRVLRQPLGRTATNAALAERIAAEGFDQLYPVEPRAASAA